jgi:hypothetical protein
MLTRRVPRYVGTFMTLFGYLAHAQVSVWDRIAVKKTRPKILANGKPLLRCAENYCLTIRRKNQVPMAIRTTLANHKLTDGHAPFLVIDKDKPRTG